MKTAQSLGFPALIVLGLGCGTDAFYAETQPLDPDLGWESEEEATFEWQVTDTLARYDFFIDLRHDQRYPFSNIYLFVDFTFPNGRTLRDTLACDLADERGRWLGTGFGNLVDHRIGFRSQTGFPLTGDYAIGIRHGMRETPLPGVSDIGFRLEPAAER